MSRGSSGRIVLEIDPSTKDLLYIALAKQRLTLKDWFLKQSASFIEQSENPSLFSEVAEKAPSYSAGRN
jgi:hypothetical protein